MQGFGNFQQYVLVPEEDIVKLQDWDLSPMWSLPDWIAKPISNCLNWSGVLFKDRTDHQIKLKLQGHFFSPYWPPQAAFIVSSAKNSNSCRVPVSPVLTHPSFCFWHFCPHTIPVTRITQVQLHSPIQCALGRTEPWKAFSRTCRKCATMIYRCT